MPEQRAPDEIVPVHLVAYERDADLDIDNSGAQPTVANHDELIESGQTFDEVRGLKRRDAEQYGLDIIEPGDTLWHEKMETIEEDGPFRLDELLSD